MPTQIPGSQIQDGTITNADIQDGGLTADDLAVTGVISGVYPTATITVNAQGQITAISAGPIMEFDTTTNKLKIWNSLTSQWRFIDTTAV